MSDESTDFGAFLAGLVVGGLIGAAAALMLAPQSGEETRAQIRQRGIELRDQANTAYDDARTRAEEFATEARTRTDKIVAETRSKASDLQTRGKAAFDERAAQVQSMLGRKTDSAPAESE